MNHIQKQLKQMLVLLLVLGTVPRLILAQNYNDYDAKKYWYYRTRLNNDFVKVGLNQGESLPIPERQYPSPKEIKMGDETSTLGIYIGVLATEYALLKKNNQNTSKVCYELFCALNAINRMDMFAEGVWGGTGSLNGFILKDDVYASFLTDNYAHFNYYNSSSNSAGQALDGNGNVITSPDAVDPKNLGSDNGFCLGGGVSRVNSDYKTVNQNPSGNKGGVSVNQDQYISMLIGLSLVNKFVDGAANWSNNVFPYETSNTTTSILQEAKNINSRIIGYFERTQFILFNPVTLTPIPSGSGGIAAPLSYAISEAANQISSNLVSNGGEGSFFFPMITGPTLIPHSGVYSLTPTPIAVGFPFWSALHYHATSGTSMDNAAFIANLNATCNCGWDPGINPFSGIACNNVLNTVCGTILGWLGLSTSVCTSISSVVCSVITIPIPGYTNHSYSGMLADVNGWSLQHALLLYQALNNTTDGTYGTTYMNTAATLLDRAPCTGPYNFGQANRPDYEWTSDSRIEHPDRREWYNDASGSKNSFPAAYNGIDYMLYYNLLALTSNSRPSPSVDLSDRIVTTTLPQNSYPYSCSGSSCTIGAFETITASNVITTNGNVAYRAGKTIHLTPGFSTQPSAIFHGYVSAFACGSNAYVRQANGGSDDKQDDAYGDMGLYPTHTVNYPAEPVVEAKAAPDYFEVEGSLLPHSSQKTVPAHVLMNEYNVQIFPNPNNGQFTLNMQLADGEQASYEVFDMVGKSLLKESNIVGSQNVVQKDITMPVDTKGFFIIRVLTSNGYSYTKKLVIH
jgi:hypothetical protein